MLRGLTPKLNNKTTLSLRYGHYGRYPLLRGVPDQHVQTTLMRYAYAPDHGFFYARVPKAANSTVVATLMQHMGADPMGDGLAQFEKAALNRLPTMRQYGRAFRFTVVRHPYARLLSAYRDKILGSARSREKYVGTTAPVSFVGFLTALKERDYLCNAHFLPQTILIPFQGADMDVIGRVETLAPDLARICEAIFGRFEGVSRAARNATAEAAQPMPVDADAVQIIRTLYVEDFRVLGYYPDAPHH